MVKITEGYDNDCATYNYEDSGFKISIDVLNQDYRVVVIDKHNKNMKVRINLTIDDVHDILDEYGIMHFDVKACLEEQHG